eukprot:GFUD01087259.1.p1 GENE.GFUD01087259.1~~GFUD01087259.1.p1  ORF type:complete len:157 (-),score=51.95 GFUD01087259.1:185-655(-)
MDSELETNHCLQGSPVDNLAEMENTSTIKLGPDSVARLLDALINNDNIAENDEGAIPKDLSNKMVKAALYVGSFFDSLSWNATSVDRYPEVEAKTTRDSKSTNVDNIGENKEEFSETEANKEGEDELDWDWDLDRDLDWDLDWNLHWELVHDIDMD